MIIMISDGLGYMGSWVHGYMGYMGTWVQGYMGIYRHIGMWGV